MGQKIIEGVATVFWWGWEGRFDTPLFFNPGWKKGDVIRLFMRG
jgi:hypothetical protein